MRSITCGDISSSLPGSHWRESTSTSVISQVSSSITRSATLPTAPSVASMPQPIISLLERRPESRAARRAAAICSRVSSTRMSPSASGCSRSIATGDTRYLRPGIQRRVLTTQVAHVPVLVVEIEVVDRADLAVLGVQRVPVQIPHLVQHAP